MFKVVSYFFCSIFFLLYQESYSQNETKKWNFGYGAALDFVTIPPTILSTSSMTVNEGCASMADTGGNLLFYTDGATVWNQSNLVMANGTGLLGTLSACQSCIIIKKPGSGVLYYIFTIQGQAGSAGLNYSVVDMSLSAGSGSVIVKNSPLCSGACAEKITATKHCNGIDYWIVIHDHSNISNNFMAFLLTGSGVNPGTVISSVGPSFFNSGYYGCMKLSPNGKKLAAVLNFFSAGILQLYDFDNSSGIISNPIMLTNTFLTYGCEFSPDGTKLYSGIDNGVGPISQWNLCSGSGTSVAASQYTLSAASGGGGNHMSMQLAPNGKIYIAYSGTSTLAVINNPNLTGAACNYSANGQSIFPKTNYYGLPNFVGSYFLQPPQSPPFTHTVSNVFGCQTASFTAPPVVQNFSLIACSASGYSLSGILWNFGNPASGINNTSTLPNPSHAYTSLGTYTAQLILYYSCGGGTDTLKQVVNVNQPCIAVNSTSITCASLGSATVSTTGGTGPYSYTWMPTAQAGSVATGLSPGTYTIVVYDAGNNITSTATTIFTSLIPLTGTLSNAATVPCNAAATGTANYTSFAGGSGSQNYTWYNGLVTYTTPSPVNLSAGTWSTTVTDALTGCTLNNTFVITQPTALTLNINSSLPAFCTPTTVILTGANSGGVPSYNYTWSAGPVSSSITLNFVPGASSVYTLHSTDANNCQVTKTISVSFAPSPTLTTNGPCCNGQNLLLNGAGGTAYAWTGPAGFNSAIQNPVVNAVGSANAGVYNLTVTSANTCTSATNTTVVVNPTPTISVAGGTTCVNAALNFTLNTFPGSSFMWSGPGSFTSNSQNPVITPAAQIHSGSYSVVVTSTSGCTNTALANALVNPIPILSVANVSICPLAFGTLNASGATTYSWNGVAGGSSFSDNPVISQQYTVGGTALGCTAIATASIILKSVPVPTITTNGPRCNGSNLILNGSAGISYLWSGPALFTAVVQNPTINVVGLINAGVYNLTLTAANSCTAAASTTVLVNPTPTVNASGSTVCSIQTLNLFSNAVAGASYLWGGPQSFTSTLQNPSIVTPALIQSGIYNVTVTSAAGCTNTAFTIANVVSPPSLGVIFSSPSLCAQALSGSPNSIVLTASGAGSYTLNTPSHIYNGNPSGPASPLSLLPPYNLTGPATATLLGSNGVCTVSTTAVFSVIPNPTLSAISPTPFICAGQLFTYTSNGASAYSWSSANPNNFLYTTGNVAVANPSINSVFSVVGGSLGCLSTLQTSTLTVNPLPVFTIWGNNLICPGTSAVLSAQGTAMTYSWSPNIFLNSNSSATVMASPPSAQNYFVTGILNTCSNTAVITVSVLPLPVAVITAPKTKFCQDEEIVLLGSGGLSYKWKGPGEYETTGQNIVVRAFSPAFNGNYTLTVSDVNTCKASVSQSITVHSLPQGYLSAKTMEGCAPFCPDLSFKQSNGGAGITDLSWSVNGVNINGANFKYCFNYPGDYKITGMISDVNTCVNTVTSSIMVYPQPVADFGFIPDTPVENLEPVQFSAISKDAVTYNWSFGSPQFFSTKKDPVFLFENTGSYPIVLVVKNQWACSDTILKTVYVSPDFAVYVPNAFTPNADGLNEMFIPVIRGNKTFTFSIFDRWGTKIYETSAIDKGWDGTFKGEPCKQEIYLWQLNVNAGDAQGKVLSGDVVLYR